MKWGNGGATAGKGVPEAPEQIAGWWMERRVLKRIMREDVRGRIAEQTLVNPIRHAAGVELPRVDDDQQLLFE